MTHKGIILSNDIITNVIKPQIIKSINNQHALPGSSCACRITKNDISNELDKINVNCDCYIV